MSKTLPLLFAFIGIFCFFGFSQAQQCEVTLESAAPPPVCHIEIINGKKEKVCEEVGPALQLLLLTPEQKSQTTDFPAVKLEFAGTCACQYILYDKVGLKGAVKKGSFSKRKYKKVIVEDIWDREVNSLKVICKFK